MIGRIHTWKIIVNVVLQTLLQRSLFHEETMRLAGLLAPFHFHSRQYIRKYCCEGSGPRWAEEDCCATIARRRCNNCHFGRPVLIEMEAQIHVDGNPLATDSTIQITKRSLHYALLHDRDLCKGSKVQGLNPLVFIRRQFLIPPPNRHVAPSHMGLWTKRQYCVNSDKYTNIELNELHQNHLVITY